MEHRSFRMMKRFFLNLFPDEIKNGQAFRATALSLIARLTGIGIILLSHVLMAQLMGANGFGNYIVIFSCLNILITISLFGFDKSMTEILPGLIEKKHWTRLKGFLKFSRRTILLVSLAIILELLLLLINQSGKYNLTFSESLFWALLLFPFLVMIQLDGAVIRTILRTKFFPWMTNAIMPVAASIVCFIYYKLNHDTLKTDAALFIYLCCAIIALIFISGKSKALQYRFPIKEVASEYDRKAWTASSLPYFVSALLALLMKNIGILYVSYYFGNTRAGIYAAAVITASIVSAFISVPQSLFLPRLREMYASREPGERKKMMSRSAKTILIFSLPVGLILILSGRFFLQIFGTAFIASYVPLIILTTGHLINFRFGLNSAIFISGESKKKYVVLNFLTVVINLAFNILLVPELGMIGAALASVLSLSLFNLWIDLRLKKKLRVND